MTIEEEFEQMMAGNDVELDNVEEEIEAEEEEVEEEGPETTEDDDAEDATETNEDTEQYDEEEAEAETDEDDDGQTDETEEGELEDEEENAQVDESKNDEADTEEKPAEEVPETTDGIDYKKFYEEVALAKFTANGKEVEGFKDPKDLIRSQQALHGLTQKMEAVKAYQPFIKPMKERKLLDDPAKFNLMMNLLDGDKEALKTVIRDMGIDTLELDTEEINYVPKNTLPTAGQLKLDETFEQARALGIDDKLATALGSWDNESFNEFVDNSAVSGDLINHINTGAYDLVQDEIRKMSMLDTTGRFTGQSTINQYKQAAAEVAARLQANANAETAKEQKAKLEEERAKLAKEQEEAEFKAKAKEKEAKVTAERKKAASVSKKKKVVKKAPNKEVDPVALKGDDFRKHFEQMLMS